MSIETPLPRSRRALLGAALGAGAVTVASLLGRPAVVRAHDPDDVLLGGGNSTGTETSITNTGSGHGFVGYGGLSGSGVHGEASIGVSGLSDSTGGTGVFGQNSATTGVNYGVRGEVASQTAVAVSGKATATGGVSYGVRGETFSSAGLGVAGYLTNTTGTGFGVYGQTNGSAGRGVYGSATNSTGTAHGVRGQAAGSGGTGVSGQATSATGATYGVQGRSDSSTGTGVYGYAANIAGATRGVYGRSDSPAGVGVEATSPYIGVRAVVTGAGAEAAVYAETAAVTAHVIDARHTAPDGVLPVIRATALGLDGVAIMGHVDSAGTGSQRAIEGIAYNGYGIYGAADKVGVYGKGDTWGGGAGVAGTGVEGEGPTGVYGVAAGPSVPPVPRPNTGVHGRATTDASSWGVYGHSTTGRGVHGQASTGRGVSGQASTGTAGYFEATTLTTGTALRAIGRVRFDNGVGIATVLSGQNSVIVTPGTDLTTSSVVTATLMGSAGGTTTVHRVAVNATTNTFTIVLTANASQNVKVGWHVFG